MRPAAGQALALGIGASGGWLAWQGGMPLPWMLGAMIAVTIASLAHAPVRPPTTLRRIVMPVIGVLLGAYVTPEVIGALGEFALLLVGLPPFLIVGAALSYQVYRRIGGLDRVTAFFSAMPGGLNDMLIIGGELGGDEKRIALAHATRIVVVIAFVAVVFGLVLGVRSAGGGGRDWVALADPSLVDWLILGACAILGQPLAERLRLPAAMILGPMILSAAAHLTEVVRIAPPGLLVVLAQIVIGTVVGARFLGSRMGDVGRDLMLGAVSAVLMLIVAVAFSGAVAGIAGLSLPATFLAYSPGGLTEMGLLALAMGVDVAIVSVTHVARILLVIFTARRAFRLVFGEEIDPRSEDRDDG